VLVLGLGDDDWSEQEFLVVLELDFGVDLSLDQGRGEIPEVEHGVENVTNRFEVALRR
jgi:hypothetical protein